VEIKVFVSYSHHDKEYLADDSLLGYLKGLESEGVSFWSDEALVAGENWDKEIKDNIETSHIALVLVSQRFLDSAYCTDVEIRRFLKKCRRTKGLVIFPIILSACEWERHEWLKSRQFLPKDGKTVEEDFTDEGRRKRLFHDIRQDLRKQIDRIRPSQPPPPPPEEPPGGKKKQRIRIYELSKELGVECKRIIEDAHREGISLNSAFNTVSPEVAEQIRKIYEQKEVAPARLNLNRLLERASYAPILCASPDGAWLATLHLNRVVHLWRTDDLSQHITIVPQRSEGYFTSCAIRQMPTGWELLMGMNNGFEEWRIAPTGTAVLTGLKSYKNLMEIRFSDDGSLILIVLLAGVLEIIRADNNKLVKRFHCDEQRLMTGSFCENARYVIAGGESGKTFIWDTTTGELIQAKNDHHGMPITVLSGIPSRSLYISAWEDGTLTVCRCRDGLTLKRIAHKEGITCAALKRNADLVFVGLKNKSFLAQEMMWQRIKWERDLPNEPIAMTSIGRDYLAVATHGGKIEIRDIDTGQTLATLVGFGADDWIMVSTDDHIVGTGYEEFLGEEGRLCRKIPEEFGLPDLNNLLTTTIGDRAMDLISSHVIENRA